MDEQKIILNKFHAFHKRFTDKRIVIYGIGNNTAYVLAHAKDKSAVAGLMDAQKAGEHIYGYRVYSDAEIIGAADVILIIARVAVEKLIYERIKHLSDSGLSIYNLNGENLRDYYASKENSYENNSYWDSSAEGLMAEIDKHSVISFDLFDTLLMRKIMRPADVFDLVQKEHESCYGASFRFAQKRIEAENQLNMSCVPNLSQIYDKLQDLTDISADEKQQLMQKEIEIERLLLTPRKTMVDCFNYAKLKGKKVIILTDMYLGSDVLAEILHENGIDGYDSLIISNEHGTTKETGGLYGLLKQIGGNPLHIGDNKKADIDRARAAGIDAYYIMSAYDMLLHSPFYKLLVDMKGIGDSLLAGDFTARLFNCPFALCQGRGRLTVDTTEKMAAFFGPMLLCFTEWLLELLAHKNFNAGNTIILFTSRDGYLIKRIYDLVRGESGLDLPEGIYFLTSRSAVSEDAAGYRGNYRRYIESLDILKYEHILVYDFATKGTVVCGLERIIGRKLELVCFNTFNIAGRYPHADRTYSMLGDFTFYELPYCFLKYYELLEIISIPRQTQFLYFDELLSPIFVDKDTEAFKNWDEIKTIQGHILRFVMENKAIFRYRHILGQAVLTADKIFGMIEPRYSIVADTVKDIFFFESPIENVRQTRWWDVLLG